MRFTGLLTGFLALALLLPALTAQEKKGDKKDVDKADKADKKDADKADKKDADKADKKDADKGDPDKPEKKPAKKKPEEKLEHGQIIPTKIVSMKADSVRDFTIELPAPDPQQMYAIQMWNMQQMQQIAQSRNAQEYAQRMMQYQQQMAMKAARGEGYTMKPVEVRATEDCKVRIMYPPFEYDDAGNPKKWTRKELDKLKAGSKLPGYPSSFDALKTGHFVQLYLAKPPSSKDSKWRPSQGSNQKKKKGDEDPPEPMPEANRLEVIMIVITGEPMR